MKKILKKYKNLEENGIPTVTGEDLSRVLQDEVNSLDKLDNQADEGNTIASSASNTPQVRRWCFTFNKKEPNNNNNTEVDIFDTFPGVLESSTVKKYVVQLESGGLTGRSHYQGYVEFNNGRTLNGLKKMWDNTIHWEPAKGDAMSNYNYCTKSECRIGGPWVRGFPKPMAVPFTVPYPWQKQVIDIYNTEPNDRTIYWFWERSGNSGKTALAKYFCLKGETLYVGGKAEDVKYQVAQWNQAGKPLRCVIWDIPRCVDNHISYNAIESIKNGIFFSGKYEANMVMMASPHIFCFSNQAPDLSMLSEDRWNVQNIDIMNMHINTQDALD